jgi:hypothetical protein
MARPPGCSFLGAHATETLATINSRETKPISVIVDSGSDITLISQQTVERLLKTPKIRVGQRINLIQVTGSVTISGYVALDLIFETPEGPVKIDVEAYVVKGMSTPFILGNDFADQYSISILRNKGDTHLQFGQSGRLLQVKNSTSPSLINEHGHAFQLRVHPDITPRSSRAKAHRKAQLQKKRRKFQNNDRSIRSTHQVVIPPESSKPIEVFVNFPFQTKTIFAEKILTTNRNPEDVYGSPDTLISLDKPFLHIANFSTFPVTISARQTVATAQNPQTWLDKSSRFTSAEKNRINQHAELIKNIIETRSQDPVRLSATAKSQVNIGYNPSLGLGIEEDPLSEPPLTGGPKTAELPGDIVMEDQLLEELDLSESLSPKQRQNMEAILVKNKYVFGLNGRLGNYDTHVEIPLVEGAKPVSIAPFPSSPAKREVMDKQMDSWLNLGVIEPSKSPWAAPVFVVYRNGKPRMVIDLRKLNEVAIADEFPIPRQEDILQALSGSQYLSTLDALAGFTQLTISEKDKEKLAFRTHRGLFHFKRMPFGYRNGPAIFQRIMQGVLAPFLWIFALVYIDDIVIFSKNFEEHISHIDQVLQAINKAKLTLSPSKCHFGYQSLLLLGQKVSRLGLSTHKEKVDAIIQLDEPKNVCDLQIFLGMMVYFSGYVPFYAWIAHPLFQLLKKENKWKWGEEETEAYELCKQVLTQAPVRAHAMPGRPYRIYSDACDFGLAAILQQVQPIKIRDLRGTKIYKKLEKAFNAKEPIPELVTHLVKTNSDVPEPGEWAASLEDTTVYVERVIGYWSRVLQSAERNYSPTEREALALKEGLIKFQPYLEGESILAITDHAALTWSKTFQNVNRRLLTWGLIFSAFPNMKIIHRAGRVHSNVDPISRLRWRLPLQNGPGIDMTESLNLKTDEDPLKNMFEELGPRFEEKLLTVASRFVATEEDSTLEIDNHMTSVKIILEDGGSINIPYSTAKAYSILIGLAPSETERWRTAYQLDPHFNKVLQSFAFDKVDDPLYPQYFYGDEGLIYFEDSQGNMRLCVPNQLRVEVMDESHNIITEGAHGGYFKMYNRISGTYYWPKMSREIKAYVKSCDVCQKSKPRRHAPVGLLHPIPIPNQPFEVVTMDFIPELPESGGFDNILVIVDKLTKYAVLSRRPLKSRSKALPSFFSIMSFLNLEYHARLYRTETPGGGKIFGGKFADLWE